MQIYLAVFSLLASFVGGIFVAFSHRAFALVTFVHAIAIGFGIIDNKVLVQLLIPEPVDGLGLIIERKLYGVVLVVLVAAHGSVSARSLQGGITMTSDSNNT